MPRSESRELAGQLRDRLEQECRVRGRAAAIAQATGFSPGHISRVLRGKAELGELFAHALMKHWNLDGKTIARGKLGRPATAVPPNLAATLDFLEGSYPREFLRQIRRQAVALGTDRRRPAWVIWIDARFWEWKQKNRSEPEQSGTFSWDEEEDVHAGRRRRAR